MRRRWFLGSLFAAPAAVVAAPSRQQADGGAYYGGGQCAECLYVMWSSATERLDGRKITGRPIMECSNSRCSQFGIAYAIPVTPLERA